MSKVVSVEERKMIFFLYLQRIEDFRNSFNKVINELESFKELLLDRKSIRPSETGDVFKCHAGTNHELQNVLKMLIKNGE